jgi:hypothetical protein
MSEIPDEAYSEACEEIKRLQDQLGAALDSRRLWMERTISARKEIERMKALLTRAAEALEHADWSTDYEDRWKHNDLITELRHL